MDVKYYNVADIVKEKTSSFNGKVKMMLGFAKIFSL
jgi:hypothetical protein